MRILVTLFRDDGDVPLLRFNIPLNGVFIWNAPLGAEIIEGGRAYSRIGITNYAIHRDVASGEEYMGNTPMNAPEAVADAVAQESSDEGVQELLRRMFLKED